MTISVTQLIDLFPEKELVEWQLRDPKKAKQISEEAMRVGKAVDELVQRQYRMERIELPMPQDVSVETCWNNWQAFLTDHHNFLLTTYSIQQELTAGEYVGHPDFRRRLPEERRGIDDLKCATQIRPSHFIQLGGYAWLEMKGLGLPTPNWLGIIRLNKDRPGYEYLQLTRLSDIQTAIDAFLCYKRLYEMRETVKGWVVAQKEAEALEG